MSQTSSFNTSPFESAGRLRGVTAAINSQIMIAVRLRLWDLRFATGPIRYLPPYGRAAHAVSLCTIIMYTQAHIRPYMEQIHDGFMKRKRIEICGPLTHLEVSVENLTEEMTLFKYESKILRRLNAEKSIPTECYSTVQSMKDNMFD